MKKSVIIILVVSGLVGSISATILMNYFVKDNLGGDFILFDKIRGIGVVESYKWVNIIRLFSVIFAELTTMVFLLLLISFYAVRSVVGFFEKRNGRGE